MSLIPWKHKQGEEGGQMLPVASFRTEMDRLFDNFFGNAPGRELAAWSPLGAWAPPLDVEETDKQILVRAEIPGVKADELDLAIQNGSLVISGEKKEKQEHEEKGYLYRERRYGSFRREVSLPSAVDDQNVKAEYKDGVLHVTLEKSQEALPRKIQVTAK